MKYYRMKNPNWDGRNPNYQWRIAVTIEEGGVEKFITLTSVNGQRQIDTMPVKDCIMVPAAYQLDSDEFHLLRNYIDCLGVNNMEEVTEEQVKAEETIDMNSGFGWLNEDRKESLRQQSNSDSRPSGTSGTGGNASSGKRCNGNPFSIPKSNIFGTGRDLGTFTSRTPTIAPPLGHPKSIGYTPDGDVKSAEEIMLELQQVQTQLGLNPAFAVKPDGKVFIKVGDESIELDHDELQQKLTKGKE